VAVVNEGIAGNRLLANGPVASLGESALARFDRDVLSLPGVTHIIVLEGINDLGFPGAKLGSLALADAGDARTADDLVKAYRQLIARAHAHGIRVIGCTLTPFEGVDVPGYYSRAKDAEREKVNRWIRTSGAFDGTIDFDRVLRDPQHPGRLAPRLASSDHLHPNDSGYRAMAAAIDLTLFR
jgi:lysophospholipase L1-like esterase